MIRKFSIEVICQSVQTLLGCADDYALMKKSVDEMYQVFSAITGVTINQLNEHKDVMLPSGKAIGMAGAAHCLLEMKRTAVFLRGINKAIALKLNEKQYKPLRILYAGTGPYGTLVVPLLLLYNPEELQVDLLDINPDSLAALQKVIDTLGLSAYIGDVYCADAVTFNVERQYDIVVSETMQNCLKNEPQVAVMQNLIPQLSPETIFIPEEISIDASLTNSKMEQDRTLYLSDETPSIGRITLGNVFKVNKNRLDVGQMRNIINIPAEAKGFPVLKLFTTVKVFENEVLCENDSSITLPIKYCDLRETKAVQIEFWYEQGAKPVIESRVREGALVKENVNSL